MRFHLSRTEDSSLQGKKKIKFKKKIARIFQDSKLKIKYQLSCVSIMDPLTIC